MIKAIETEYRGYKFRSRLEARWAIFFDVLKIRWEYEPEGYKTSEGWYLHDFYLTDLEMFVEVKPDNGDFSKSICFAMEKPCKLIMCEGIPDFKFYFITCGRTYEDKEPPFFECGKFSINVYQSVKHLSVKHGIFVCKCYGCDGDVIENENCFSIQPRAFIKSNVYFKKQYETAVNTAKQYRFEHLNK